MALMNGYLFAGVLGAGFGVIGAVAWFWWVFKDMYR